MVAEAVLGTGISNFRIISIDMNSCTFSSLASPGEAPPRRRERLFCDVFRSEERSMKKVSGKNRRKEGKKEKGVAKGGNSNNVTSHCYHNASSKR